MDVTLTKFNEVYLRIKCEPSVAKELSEFFTFEVPNAKFMPSVRNRLWDGKIRLFSPGTGKSILDYYLMYEDFLRSRGIKSNMIAHLYLPKNLTRKLQPNLYARWRKESSERETIR